MLAPKPTPKLRSITVPTDNEDVFEALCRRDNWLHEACSDHIRAIVGTDAAAKVNAIHRGRDEGLGARGCRRDQTTGATSSTGRRPGP